MSIEAVQYINVDRPGFVWKAKMHAAPLVNMVGRYPSAALNDYIKWEEIDEHSARAAMTWQGVSGSMVFTFMTMVIWSAI